MKKFFSVLLLCLLVGATCFAKGNDTIYRFKNGSADLEYQTYTSAVIYNCSFRPMYVNDIYICNGGHETVNDDYVVITTNYYQYYYRVYCEFEGSIFKVYILEDK